MVLPISYFHALKAVDVFINVKWLHEIEIIACFSSQVDIIVTVSDMPFAFGCLLPWIFYISSRWIVSRSSYLENSSVNQKSRPEHEFLS